MRRYGIVEMARTGRICLKRGANRLEPDLKVPESMPSASSSREQQQPISRCLLDAHYHDTFPA
jgi:hypothetical protein